MGWAELRTTDLPRADRFEWWVDLVARDLIPTHISSEHQGDFRASAAALELGPVNVSGLSFPTLRSSRTPGLIRRSDPELWELAYVTRGTMGIDQDRSRARAQAGDLLLYDTSRPFEVQVTEGGQITILHLPRHAVPLPACSMRDLLSRSLPGGGSGALLARFLHGLAGGQFGGVEAERLGSAAVQLASAFLGALSDRERLLPPETRHTLLLHQLKAYIETHLTDPHLSPQTIADAHAISVRYLHHLFRTEERTVSSLIRELRLERCRMDLAQSGFGQHPVAAIGARWGFTDAAVFSRAFKAAFGMPPGEYRKRRGAR